MKAIMVMVMIMVASISMGATVGERNNNPGNVKKPGSDTWNGTSGYDDRGHVIFKDLDYGIRALYKNFKTRQGRCPDMTLLHYFSNVYAEENGNFEAEYIASQQNISVNTKLKDVDIGEMVIAVAWFESRMVLTKKHVDHVKAKFKL